VTRAARFSQADLLRAMRAAEKAGWPVVELCPDGTIRVLTGEPKAANDSFNPLDKMLHG